MAQTFEEACFVRCDRTTMTQDDFDNGPAGRTGGSGAISAEAGVRRLPASRPPEGRVPHLPPFSSAVVAPQRSYWMAYGSGTQDSFLDNLTSGRLGQAGQIVSSARIGVAA